MIHDNEFGRIEIRTVPFPAEMEMESGTYTYSGRVLVSYRTAQDPGEADWYHVATVCDDGTDLRPVYSGKIPQLKGANGVRWMCFPDNKRILLGDYVLECHPDIDRCDRAELIRLVYPDAVLNSPDIFCHWSEIIIAPDNEHMCWTALSMNGATNYLGRLVRGESHYTLGDVCVVSTIDGPKPDPEHEGYVIPQPTRGGEVKQFIWGGKALAMVGGSNSIADSVVQPLLSEETIAITHTPCYEETTIFSGDERLGVVMSPRFSEKTSCAIFGLVPLPHATATMHKIINVIYKYCVSGVRAFRKGNIGPVLIDIERSRSGGRGYMGVNLSDPQGKWVYYSPISWHPDSTRAMWNEGMRLSEGKKQMRLRMCHLLDYQPGKPVAAQATPDAGQIPYALPLREKPICVDPPIYPIKIKGKAGGRVINNCRAGEAPLWETIYENFSDDGLTVYNGRLSVTAPDGIFSPGKTVFEADLSVSGAHHGEMKLVAVFAVEGAHSPAMLSFAPNEDGMPESHGHATYDGVTLRIEDMEP